MMVRSGVYHGGYRCLVSKRSTSVIRELEQMKTFGQQLREQEARTYQFLTLLEALRV